MIKSNVRLDILARILASENVKVVYDTKATTASFNLKTRVLTVPKWQDITRNIHILFIGHEVSHALETPLAIIEMVEKKYGKPRFDMQLLNIVEDIRIEKLICHRFPKLTPFFQSGYTDLVECGFWEIPDGITELSAPFESRINAQAKLRNDIDVKFNDEEQEIFDWLKGMWTVADCIEGYGKVLDYLEKNDPVYVARRKLNEELSKRIAQGLSDLGEFLKNGEGVPGGNGNGKGNASGNGSETSGNGSDKIGDVVAAASRMIAEAAHAQQKSKSYGFGYDYSSYAKATHMVATLNASAVNRVDDDKATVAALVSEFQRKKAAMASVKRREHHTGDLSEKLLHKTRFSDDVFRTNTYEPIGLNHGVSFLIDISGSMSRVIQRVMRRVVLLTDFCDKLHIPYIVYGFTDGSRGGTVYEFYKSTMPKPARENAINSLLSARFPIQMGGTPLSSCFELYATMVKKFRVDNRIDLMTSVLLTDGGEGCSDKMTNYYGDDGVFVECSVAVSRCEILNKHLRDVGMNTIHHHIGTKENYPFEHVTWTTNNAAINFSKKDEIFGLRIVEKVGNDTCDEKMYARMIADIMNNRN